MYIVYCIFCQEILILHQWPNPRNQNHNPLQFWILGQILKAPYPPPKIPLGWSCVTLICWLVVLMFRLISARPSSDSASKSSSAWSIWWARLVISLSFSAISRFHWIRCWASRFFKFSISCELKMSRFYR